MKTSKVILVAALALTLAPLTTMAAGSSFLVQATIVQPVNASIQAATLQNTALTTTALARDQRGTSAMQLTIAGPAERTLSVSTTHTQVAVCTQAECAGDQITVDNIRLSGDISENGNGVTNAHGLIPAAMIDSHAAIPDGARPGQYTASTLIHIAFA